MDFLGNACFLQTLRSQNAQRICFKKLCGIFLLLFWDFPDSIFAMIQWLLINFILIPLAGAQIAWLATEARIFDYPRAWLEAWSGPGGFIGYLVNCPVCFSHWAVAVLYLGINDWSGIIVKIFFIRSLISGINVTGEILFAIVIYFAMVRICRKLL